MRFAAGDMWMTGDEPRYAAEGVGLYADGSLTPSDAAWHDFLRRSELSEATYGNAGHGAAFAPSLAPAAIFGPALHWGGLQAARWLAFLFALAGLAALLRVAGAPATAAAALSFPLLVYAWLIYPEVLLFCTTSLALAAFAVRRPLLALGPAALMPFVHVRALPLSIALAAVAFCEARRIGSPRAAHAAIAYAVALGGFVVLQHATFGSLAGPAFAAHPIELTSFFERLGMQLFGVRHGLLIYAPLFVVGFAGLIAASIAGRRDARYALLLLTIYVLTFVWSDAAESYSARFWTAGVPMLAFGLAEWIGAVPRKVLFATLPFALLGAANVAAFVYNQSWYVENRTQALGYAWLAAQLHLPIRVPLPVDDAGQTNAGVLAAWFGSAIVVTVLIALPAVRPLSRWASDEAAASTDRSSTPARQS